MAEVFIGQVLNLKACNSQQADTQQISLIKHLGPETYIEEARVPRVHAPNVLFTLSRSDILSSGVLTFELEAGESLREGWIYRRRCERMIVAARSRVFMGVLEGKTRAIFSSAHPRW